MSHSRTSQRETKTCRSSLLRLVAAWLLLGVSVYVPAYGDQNDDEVLYIGDVGDDTVKTIDAKTGKLVGTFVESGSGGLSGPMGLIFRGGRLLVVNQNFGADNGEILRYNRRTGDFVDPLVASDDPNAPYAPRGMVRAPYGDTLYVADVGTQDDDCRNQGRIARYRGSNGQYLGDLDRSGFGAAFHPRGLVLGPDGLLYVSAIGCPLPEDPLFAPLTGYILRFNPGTGRFLNVFASDLTVTSLHRPEGLVFDEHGDIWVASFRADAADSDKILKLDGKTGKLRSVLPLAPPTSSGGKRAYAQAILFGPGGDLFIPISGGDGSVAGEVRRCDTHRKSLSCKVIVPANGTLIAPYYLTFEHTNPSTLEFEGH